MNDHRSIPYECGATSAAAVADTEKDQIASLCVLCAFCMRVRAHGQPEKFHNCRISEYVPLPHIIIIIMIMMCSIYWNIISHMQSANEIVRSTRMGLHCTRSRYRYQYTHSHWRKRAHAKHDCRFAKRNQYTQLCRVCVLWSTAYRSAVCGMRRARARTHTHMSTKRMAVMLNADAAKNVSWRRFRTFERERCNRRRGRRHGKTRSKRY